MDFSPDHCSRPLASALQVAYFLDKFGEGVHEGEGEGQEEEDGQEEEELVEEEEQEEELVEQDVEDVEEEVEDVEEEVEDVDGIAPAPPSPGSQPVGSRPAGAQVISDHWVTIKGSS